MGHPDKVADQISDGVLDAVLEQDPASRVACESLVKKQIAVLAGEITTRAEVNYVNVARKVIADIGYNDPALGFDSESCFILQALSRQSPDIAMGVDSDPSRNKDQGAGDQGMMFGYACNETPELMPLPILLAHRMVQKLAEMRQKGMLKYLRPDGKSQVTVEYEGMRPLRVTTCVISTHHCPDVSQEQIKADVEREVIRPSIPADMMSESLECHVNPTGRFEHGGPAADCGLTGRKIIVDTYGGRGRHGGGAFSGKDPSKVDRSASYATRWVAKNVVAAGLADICEVQVAYAIGVARPVSIHVYTEGTGKISEDRIVEAVKKTFDLRPAAIIEELNLRRPIFLQTARNGHFGREEDNFTWERTDKVEELRRNAGV